MLAIKLKRPLSPRRQRELGVSSPAEFLWIMRPGLRRLMRLFRVNRWRDLLNLYGKERGCWQFHHHKEPSRVMPDDETELLARCHFSNIEPVTWQENMNHRKTPPAVQDGQPTLL